MDYEDGEVEESLINDHLAKKNISGRTADDDTNAVKKHVEVCIAPVRDQIRSLGIFFLVRSITEFVFLQVTEERLSVPEQTPVRSPALPQHLIGQGKTKHPVWRFQWPLLMWIRQCSP